MTPRPPSPARRVALLVDLDSHVHRGVVQGICRYTRKQGPWDFCCVQRHASLPWPVWANLRPDGVIAYAPTPESSHALAKAGCAVVNLAEAGEGCAPLPAVLKDSVQIGRLAAEHFLERGFTRVAFASHQKIPSGRAIAQGVRDAAGARNVHEMELRFPLTADWQWQQHQDEITAWIRALPAKTGLVACNDYFARQLLDAAEHLGRRIPDELSIVGVNDSPVECELSRVPLSSVVIAAERIGWEACRLLEKQWAGLLSSPAETVLVEPISVAVRASSDVFALDDEVIGKVLHRLHDNGGRESDVETLVRQSGLSRRRFEVRFRAAVGHSPYEEILRLRITRARELLAQSDLKIEAIAQQCGFSEAKVFHRHFRKLTGMTPAQFRAGSVPGTASYPAAAYRPPAARARQA